MKLINKAGNPGHARREYDWYTKYPGNDWLELALYEFLRKSFHQSSPALYSECKRDQDLWDLLRLTILLRFCVRRDAHVVKERKMFCTGYDITDQEEELISTSVVEIKVFLKS